MALSRFDVPVNHNCKLTWLEAEQKLDIRLARKTLVARIRQIHSRLFLEHYFQPWTHVCLRRYFRHKLPTVQRSYSDINVGNKLFCTRKTKLQILPVSLLLVFKKSNILKVICYHTEQSRMTLTGINQANLLPAVFLESPPPLPATLIIPRRRNAKAPITQFIKHKQHQKI